MSFKSPPSSDSQSAPSFHASLSIVVRNILWRYLTPSLLIRIATRVPIPYVSRHVRKTEAGFAELRLHILEMISSARSSIVAGDSATIKNDALLRNLVDANMKEDGEYRSLTDEELLADIFVGLIHFF